MAATTSWRSKATSRRCWGTSACGWTTPRPPPDDACQTVDGDHGRIEIRRATVAHDVAWLEHHRFPGLAAVAKVTAVRELDGKTTTASRYYLLSKPLPAARLAQVVRAHWQIENRLH